MVITVVILSVIVCIVVIVVCAVDCVVGLVTAATYLNIFKRDKDLRWLHNIQNAVR